MFQSASTQSDLLRLEAEFYTTKTFSFAQGAFTGAEVIDFVQYGTSDELNEDGLGYPVLRLNEFDSCFIARPAKFCDKIDQAAYQSLLLRKDDVLICRTNGNPRLVGKAAIVPQDYDFAYASYLFKIRPKRALISSAALMLFLNSKYGRMEIEKFSMQSNQVNFSPAKFREMRVPKLGTSLNDAIDKRVSTAFERHKQSQHRYSQAENLLLEALGLAGFAPSGEAVNVKAFKDSFGATGRLDAEYYQPKYEEYQQHIVGNKNGHTMIRDAYDLVKSVSRRDKPSYDYIEISDVNVGDGTVKPNRIDTADLPDNAKQEVQRGDLLISKVRPNRGAVCVINGDDTDLIVSGAFTVLRQKPRSDFSCQMLQVLLRSKIYRDWMLQFNIGTQYPVIRDEDILHLPIPVVPKNTQTQIAALVQESFAFKAESERLLEQAKRAVETAIEQDEAAALRLLAAE